MNVYLPNGYADMKKIMSLPYPLIFVIGGRGTGKTYGACKELLALPENEKFFFLRRTQDEADAISYYDFSPFQPVIEDNPEEYKPIVVEKVPHVKNISGVWHGKLNDDGVMVADGDALGYIGALSTIHKIRGFNMQSVTIGVYDEFIPEKHVSAFRGGASGEGQALLNCIETIGRNRELKGKKPFKMVCLSNANTIASPIFQSLGIIDSVNKMALKGKQECILPERGIAVFIFRDSPISEAKKNTSLYKASADGDFATMALKNDFDASTYMFIGAKPIEEYKILAKVGEDVYIYKHKSNNDYYVTRHRSGTPKRVYNDDEMSKRRFKRTESNFLDAWLHGNISFSDYYCKYILTNIL